MSQKKLTVMQLYPNDMNIYGDWGNALTLMKRIEWHGYGVELINYNVGDELSHADIIVGGGGQDSGQIKIQDDLQKRGEAFKQLADDGTPMLLVCGLYQLFGRFFKTRNGEIIPGISIFDAETHGGNERLIGNVIISHPKFGEILGYENHSGQTFLGKSATPLGRVIKGAGNNGHDETEGIIYKNTLGTYLHGSILPKNPTLADFLIEQAAIRAYGEFTPNFIDDRFAEKAREIARKRPR
jgi:CobQ-like glutamine amidotransferase family enzyme